MPLIADFDPNTDLPIGVDTGGHADPASFSAPWNALANAGAQLTDVSNQFGQKLIENQRAVEAMNKKAAGFSQLDDAEQKASLIPNRQQAIDQFTADAGKIGDDILSEIDSPSVRAHVQDALMMRAASGRASVAIQSFQRESSAQVATLDDHLQGYGHQLATAQNDVERASILDAAHGETKAMVAGGYIPAAAGEERFLAMRGRAAYAQADGDIATNPSMAAARLADHTNYPDLDEKARDILLMRAESKIQGNNAVLQGRVNQDFGDNLASIKSTGLPAVALPESQIRSAFPTQADQMLDDLNRATQVFKARTATALTSPSEDNALIEKWAPHGAGFADQQQDQRTIAQTVNAKWQAISENPAGYVLNASPEIAAGFKAAQSDPTKLAPAVSALDAAYDKLNVPSYQRAVLPVDQANSIVASLLAAPPDQRAAAMTSMAQSYGGLFPRVIGDLVKAKLPPAYEALAALPNSADRVALANGIGDGKKATEEALPKGAAAAIDDGVTSDPNFQDFTKSMSYAAGGAAKAGQMVNVAKLIASGHVLGGATPADAARAAVASFTANKYDFWENGDGMARVPKSPNWNLPQVETAADHVIAALTPEQLSFPAYLPKNTGADPETLSRAAMLTVQNGKWVTNEQDNGLIRLDSNGYPVTLKNGQRLELPFASVGSILHTMPPAAPQPRATFPGANQQ